MSAAEVSEIVRAVGASNDPTLTRKRKSRSETEAEAEFLDSIFAEVADDDFPLDLPPASPERRSPHELAVLSLESNASSRRVEGFEVKGTLWRPRHREPVKESREEWLKENVIGVVETKSVSSIARVQISALTAKRDATLNFMYDENETLKGAICDGVFFGIEELQKASLFGARGTTVGARL